MYNQNWFGVTCGAIPDQKMKNQEILYLTQQIVFQ